MLPRRESTGCCCAEKLLAAFTRKVSRRDEKPSTASEVSYSSFLYSSILVQESLALIRKPKQSVTIQPQKLTLRWQRRRLGRPSTQPRPTAQRPPSGLSRSTPCVIACGICAAPAAPCRPHPGGPCALLLTGSALMWKRLSASS